MTEERNPAYGIITAKAARAATTIKYAAAQCSQMVRRRAKA
jgi:hypothetical protein